MQASKNSLFAPLGNRQFRLLLASDAISNVGDWLYNIVLLVFVYQRTRSAAWVGTANIVRIAPEIGLSTLGGVIADRFDRRLVMVVSCAVRGVLMFALALVAIASAPVALALVIVFVSTALGTPYLAAIVAAVPSVVVEDQLAAANALISGLGYLTLGLGPALGGLLILVASPWVAFAVNGASFLAGALMLTVLEPQPVAEAEEAIPLRTRVRQGFEAITSSADVSAVVGLIPIVTFIPGNSFVLLILVSRNLVGTGAGGLTFMFAAIGAGGLLGTWAAKYLEAQHRPGLILVATTLVLSFSFGGLALASIPVVAYILCASIGASVIVFEVLSVTLIQRLLAPEVVGRVFGIMNTLVYSGILIGSVVGSVLVEVWGLRSALVIAGTVPLVLVLILASRVRRIDSRSQQVLRGLGPAIDLLDKLGIFSGAPRATLESLARNGEEVRVDAGQVVLREGDPADDFFVVRSGTLDVTSTGESGGSAHKVNTLGPADYFGEVGLIEGLPRTATVRTVSECSLYRIGGATFLDAVTQTPVISGALLGGLTSRLARTHPSHRSRLGETGTLGPRARLGDGDDLEQARSDG